VSLTLTLFQIATDESLPRVFEGRLLIAGAITSREVGEDRNEQCQPKELTLPPMLSGGHRRDAVPWLRNALEVFESVDARLPVATVWGEMAVRHMGLGDDGKALELFQKVAQRNSDAGAIPNYQVALANIGNVYLYQRDYLAIQYYQRALALAREIREPVSIKNWTYDINLAYARIRQSVDEQHPKTA